MAQYRVRDGDTLQGIAARFDLTWSQLYEHEGNAALRNVRPDRNRIYPGDFLWVPNIERVDFVVVVQGFILENSEKTRALANPSVWHGAETLHAHEVQDGETLESLAAALDLEWEDLALLNWGTTDPEEVDFYLQHLVGCTKKEGGKFVFQATDRPGIIQLPRPLMPETGKVHMCFRASRFPEVS